MPWSKKKSWIQKRGCPPYPEKQRSFPAGKGKFIMSNFGKKRNSSCAFQDGVLRELPSNTYIRNCIFIIVNAHHFFLACQYSSGLNDSWLLVKRQEWNVLHVTDFIPHLVIVSTWVPSIGITRAPFPSFFPFKIVFLPDFFIWCQIVWFFQTVTGILPFWHRLHTLRIWNGK